MRSLNTSATGMIAQQLNLDVIANNLANVNTTAFKHQRAEFQDLMYQTVQAAGSFASDTQKTPQGLQIGLGTRNSATSSDFSQGAVLNTGKPTDMMIMGEGFFRVKRPDGGTAYTRDGSFSRDDTGLLVSSDGYPLDPPISIPDKTTVVSIGADGTVQANVAGESTPQVLGKVQVATFVNPAGLTRLGQNLYQESAASGSETIATPGLEGTGTISAGHLEGSNVQIVEEMVRMIQAQRAYEINSKAIQTSDEMLNTMNGLKR